MSSTIARRLAASLGRPAPSASIVSVPVVDAPSVKAALASQGIRCAATTPTTIRLSPHIYNTVGDVDRAAELLLPSCNKLSRVPPHLRKRLRSN